MVKSVDRIMVTTLNVCWVHSIDADTLQTLIGQKVAPGKYFGQMHQLYSEVAAPLIIEWATVHGLSKTSLEEYYDTYLAHTEDLNPELEKWFHGVLGTPV